MRFISVGFSTLIVGCQRKITGFDGLVYLFLNKVTFHQSHPVGRVERRFVDEFVVIDDSRFYLVGRCQIIGCEGHIFFIFGITRFTSVEPFFGCIRVSHVQIEKYDINDCFQFVGIRYRT